MGRKKLRYNRVLLKLSGEVLKGENPIDGIKLHFLANEILKAKSIGVQIAIVLGGGNIFRGDLVRQVGEWKISRVQGDYIGMLATVINSIALKDALEKLKIPAEIFTMIPVGSIINSYNRSDAVEHLKKGRVVIFAGGTGSPYVTTDTAAALKSIEIEADCLLKATKVDGIYSDDPVKNKNARIYREISYEEFLKKKLKIIDTTAISLCMENKMPVIVFNFFSKGNIIRILKGEKIGSIIIGDNSQLQGGNYA